MIRPLLVLTPLAAALVAWFTIRTWFGHDPTVWRVSALLGGWAPVLGAALLTYLRREGHREDSVGAAWLARALGVHCVLLWMVGVSDWLRGPPNTPHAWNLDSGTPLVFLAFVPCFALCATAAHHLWALASEPRAPRVRRVLDPAPTHYRAPPATAREGVARRVLAGAPWFPPAACALILSGALIAPVTPMVSALLAAGLCGAVGTRQTLVPSLVALAALTARAVFNGGGLDSLAMRWPALLVVALGVYTLVASRAGQRMTTQRTWG